MKLKHALSPAAVMTGLFAMPFAALAQFDPGVTQAQIGSGLIGGSFSTLINRVIRFGLYVIGGLAIIMFIYSGFLYITANGDDSKAGDAKKVMMYSIVGVLGSSPARTRRRYSA